MVNGVIAMMTEKYLSELCKSYYDLKYSFYQLISVMCKDDGLTVLQSMTLFLIRSEDSVTIGDLSRYFNITHSNASSMCKKLEKDGLILRRRSVTDERSVILSLSEEGTAVLERMLKRGKVLTDPLSDIPQERLDRVLTTIREATALISDMEH